MADLQSLAIQEQQFSEDSDDRQIGIKNFEYDMNDGE